MWQELNETNQTESGDDFFQENLLKTQSTIPPLSMPFHSYLEFKDILRQKACWISKCFLFNEKFPNKLLENYSNYLYYLEESKKELYINS
jgi:hypothetical protein